MTSDLINPEEDQEYRNVRLWRRARLEEEGKLCVVVDRKTKREGVRDLVHGWLDGARANLAQRRTT